MIDFLDFFLYCYGASGSVLHGGIFSIRGRYFSLSPFHVDSTAGLAISGAIFGDTADK